MSDTRSALDGARFDGLIAVEDCGLVGMITLRGDLSAKPLRSAVKTVVGVDVPKVGQMSVRDGSGACWMSPDELLLLCPHDMAEAHVLDLSFALADHHHLAVNVSDARAMLRLEGAEAREVLAKLCPLDMSPGAFEPGQIRRTRMAQVPAAVWLDEDGAFRVVCFRSVAGYVFNLLKVAAGPGGRVGAF